MEDLSDLQAELGTGVTLLSDPLGRAVDAYGVRDPRGVPKDPLARPATFHVDRSGVLRDRWLAAAYRQRPDPEEILAALR